jgi:hypothetical protein
MRKIFMIIGSTLLMQVCFVQNNISQEKKDDDLQSFFQRPSSSRLTEIIKKLDSDSTLSSDPNSQAPIIGFLTVALARYRDHQDAYLKLASGLKSSQNLVFFCFRLSQKKDTILHWTGHHPSLNDMFWGAYFASGDTRYLKRLVSEMALCERTDSLMLFMTGSSAKWSLCSNACQYPEVKKYLTDAIKTSPNNLLPYIKETLELSPSEVKDKWFAGVLEFKKGMEKNAVDSVCASSDYSHDGLQLHCALIGNKKFFDDWQKPVTPKIEPIDTYKRGEEVFPIIVFATNGKDFQLNANLTYDITITKPDGSIYGHFEQLNVWKDSPAPVLHLLKQSIDIRLEQTDPLGVYKVYMIIYENNKKVKVDVNLSFRVI